MGLSECRPLWTMNVCEKCNAFYYITVIITLYYSYRKSGPVH